MANKFGLRYPLITPDRHTCRICGSTWSCSVDKCDCMVEKYCGRCGSRLPECSCTRYRTEVFEIEKPHEADFEDYRVYVNEYVYWLENKFGIVTYEVNNGPRQKGDECVRCGHVITKCTCEDYFCPFCGDPLDEEVANAINQGVCHCGRWIHVNEIKEV